MHRPDDAPSPRAHSATRRASQEVSATIIQARWRGESSRRDTIIKKRSRMPSLVSVSHALAAPVKAVFEKAAISGATAAISEELRKDIVGAKEVLENHLEFPFLGSHTHPMHGLQVTLTLTLALALALTLTLIPNPNPNPNP